SSNSSPRCPRRPRGRSRSSPCGRRSGRARSPASRAEQGRSRLRRMSNDLLYDLPGLHIRDVTLDVPLDRSAPARAMIEVFARVVTAHGGGDRPYAVYLQGGPGVEAPRPSLEPVSPTWLPRVLEDYQLILLDQRGTGRSTPVGLDTPAPGLREAGAHDPAAPEAPTTLRTASAAAASEYLTHFRADAIVEDGLAVLAPLGGATIPTIG